MVRRCASKGRRVLCMLMHLHAVEAGCASGCKRGHHTMLWVPGVVTNRLPSGHAASAGLL